MIPRLKKKEIPLMDSDKEFLASVREVVFEKNEIGLYACNSLAASRARRLIQIIDYQNHFYTGYRAELFGEKLAPGTPDPRDYGEDMKCQECGKDVPADGYILIEIEEWMGKDDAGNSCYSKYSVELCSYKCVREYFKDW